MQKTDFIRQLAESLNTTERETSVARALNITQQSVNQWPPVITQRIANSVVADFVRVGRRVPAWLVQFVRGKL